MRGTQRVSTQRFGPGVETVRDSFAVAPTCGTSQNAEQCDHHMGPKLNPRPRCRTACQGATEKSTIATRLYLWKPTDSVRRAPEAVFKSTRPSLSDDSLFTIV